MILHTFSRPAHHAGLFQIPLMKKSFPVIILFCFCHLLIYAQKPLTDSRVSSYYTYIYKLSPEDVLKIYKYPDTDPDANILRHPVDSFKTDKYFNDMLPPGNYIQVFAKKNQLNYKLVEEHSVFVQLLDNNYDRRFILINRQGKEVTDALVRANGKTVRFDHISKTFHLPHRRKTLVVEADYNGVANFFKITGGESDNDYGDRSWWERTFPGFVKLFKKRNRYNYAANHPYSGFMVFNKPKYRPHDTVKFKAFILNTHSKLPITNEKLLVVLAKSGAREQKKLATITKYRDGGFEYSFVLTDSLKLLLDQYYTVRLEDPDSVKDLKKTRRIIITWPLMATGFTRTVASNTRNTI
jgi:hypothetical protein